MTMTMTNYDREGMQMKRFAEVVCRALDKLGVTGIDQVEMETLGKAIDDQYDMMRSEENPNWVIPDPHIACAALKGETAVLKTILTAITQRCPEAKKLFIEFWTEGHGGIWDFGGPGADNEPVYAMMEKLRSEILGPLKLEV